jgi:hypothetical protein
MLVTEVKLESLDDPVPSAVSSLAALLIRSAPFSRFSAVNNQVNISSDNVPL